MRKDNVKLSLHVSSELNQQLDDMAKKTHSSKSDVLKKGIALMEVAVSEKEKGNDLSVINKNGKIIKKIVGVGS